MRRTGQIVLLLSLISHIRCDDLYVVDAPADFLTFSQTDIKSSQLGSLLNAAAGVTPSKGAYEGVNILSPFRYPRLVTVLWVRVLDGQQSRLPAAASWRHLTVSGSADVETAFHELDMGLAKQPNTLPAVRLQAEQDEDTAAPPTSTAALNASRPAERRLLRELVMLEEAGLKLTQQQGRRAVLLEVETLPGVEEEREAAKAVADAVARYAEAARAASGGQALTLLITQPTLVRKTRSLLADPTSAPDTLELNLAGVYTGDYPVIFNIILITSIILVYILVAFSAMTAYMDPGKDSIIYRMTNPNMKKNN